jgi:arsenate reductase
MGKKKQRVLFICTNNSARSQMGEGLLTAKFGNRYEVFSAGTSPTQVNPYALSVMKEKGIDISGHKSKSLTEFQEDKFDIVVTVCESARESCPFFSGGRIVHKGFSDPAALKGTNEEKQEAFRKSRDEIDDWIKAYFS